MPNNLNPLNHLSQEKSPYLLQHAKNPVSWYPWGDLAFDRAKLEAKPVLLSIGYSTCHWCHVMAHESFEDEGIAKIINDNFIAIKVDREERPDIDHIYMTAATSMTGQGGWPLTVFLTPQGDPFYAGTYFSPYAKWGSIGFIDLLNSIAREWKQNREDIVSSSLSITDNLRRKNVAASPAGAVVDQSIIDLAFRHLRGQFDSSNGGFQSAPKFPMGHNLSFLLRYYKSRNNQEALSMVEKTLKAMACGGIWDHLEGGFHRYSTDANWHVPHFEKMLYDQALLSRAYLECYQVTGLREFELMARQTLDYVLNQMTDPLGGFYSAEDADSMEKNENHLKEGAFYVFSCEEIETALGHEVAEVFNYTYGVLPQGNVNFDPHGEFINKNVLFLAHTIEESASHFSRQKDEIQGILDIAKARLKVLRSLRPRPHLDDKVLCDWNGLMIASFAFAGRVLGEEKYSQAATRAADFILLHMIDNNRLLHRWREAQVGIAATLDDYSFLVYALLEVYEATFQDKYLKASKDLADAMIEDFADGSQGFYMTAKNAENLIFRPKEVYDGAIPSGNSVAALVLLKLFTITKLEIYQMHVDHLFKYFMPVVSRSPSAHSFLLSALDWQLESPLEITFKGNRDHPKFLSMLKVLYKHFIPSKSITFIQGENDAQVQLCYKGTCRMPITDIGVLDKELLNLTKD